MTIKFEKLKDFYEKYYNNDFIYMLVNNIDKEWDWEYLSRNENIPMNVIENNINKPWNWYGISININTSLYKANGYFDFYKKKLYLDVSVSSHFKNTYPKILKKMKYNKNTKGYTYEYSL